MDKKSLDKVTASAKTYCKQLGQYRMPFAWAAINVIDLITGNQSAASGVTQEGASTGGGTKDRKDSASMSSKRESSASLNIGKD